MDKSQIISSGKTFLGIELGSTRIKAVLIGEDCAPIASGAHDWENRLEDGVWTYRLDDVWTGLQDCYRKLSEDVSSRYGIRLSTVSGIGISAMMHGYMVFGKNDAQLTPFRTWRNTSTEQAAALLTEKFNFNIPQRWSIAHLYQAILNGEAHVKDISYITTLSGYVHLLLTGQNVLGIGDASGVFPIDSRSNSYDAGMLATFGSMTDDLQLGWKLEDILPTVLGAGEDAGRLTEEGAKLLDPTGTLNAGIPLCPPEGDAGTGMVATNSIAERTGNVSAGTSVFAMIVLEKELSKVYTEVDMVTTPSGKPVAMVHCNSCTSDLDAWIRLFSEVLDAMGAAVGKSALYDALYFKALEADADCGGLLSYNYYSGEPITNIDGGRPLFTRTPDSRLTLPNFMRTLLFSTMGTLKLGMDILTNKENVRLERLLGHGGLFKTKGVGQKLMAAALNVPVAVMDSAGEGGAWGIALLSAFGGLKNTGETLEAFLNNRVFRQNSGSCVEPDPNDIRSFNLFMERYAKGLAIEQAAVDSLALD